MNAMKYISDKVKAVTSRLGRAALIGGLAAAILLTPTGKAKADLINVYTGRDLVAPFGGTLSAAPLSNTLETPMEYQTSDGARAPIDASQGAWHGVFTNSTGNPVGWAWNEWAGAFPGFDAYLTGQLVEKVSDAPVYGTYDLLEDGEQVAGATFFNTPTHGGRIGVFNTDTGDFALDPGNLAYVIGSTPPWAKGTVEVNGIVGQTATAELPFFNASGQNYLGRVAAIDNPLGPGPDDPSPGVVPEPASLSLLGLGVAELARRRRNERDGKAA